MDNEVFENKRFLNYLFGKYARSDVFQLPRALARGNKLRMIWALARSHFFAQTKVHFYSNFMNHALKHVAIE